MKYVIGRELTKGQKADIRSLWNNEYPEVIRHSMQEDTDAYLSKLVDARHILAIDGNETIGWYVDFIRDDKRFFALIVSSNYRGRGIGSELLSIAKKDRDELNGWIVTSDSYLIKDGKPYKSPLKFYQKNDFVLHKEIVSETNVLNTVLIKWMK